MRALRKGQARSWCLQPGIRGEVRLVDRAFVIGPSALTEAMGKLNRHFAAAPLSAQSDSPPLTAATLCNRASERLSFTINLNAWQNKREVRKIYGEGKGVSGREDHGG